eukprot:TRINITY_DN51030_c0_g1_i1.p1 TRINITY_DN51030_c0_g1~~TRINITY_DN51030_c0_g1_i1.p1  ORF type:complete len:318 (+),score=66.82 TRINITY_DN51030_c0_g1_i1:73-954(+)
MAAPCGSAGLVSSRCRATPSEVIGVLVDTVAAANKDQVTATEGDPRSDFECVTVPRQPFSMYMKRFEKFRGADDLWTMALCMVHRLQVTADMLISPITVHRLMACALATSIKLAHDYNKVNALVADFGGMDAEDLTDMEWTFLELIDWEVNVWREEYDIIRDNLAAIEEHARELSQTRVARGDKQAMLLPESVARQLQEARAFARNRPAALRTPGSATQWLLPAPLSSPLPPLASKIRVRPSVDAGGRQQVYVRTLRRMDEAVAQGRRQGGSLPGVAALGGVLGCSVRSVATA